MIQSRLVALLSLGVALLIAPCANGRIAANSQLLEPFNDRAQTIWPPFACAPAGQGRWLSEDPIGESGGINLYGYVGNGPLNARDPFGLDLIPLDDNAKKALGDLKQLNDREMKDIIDHLEKSKYVHRIESRYKDDWGSRATGIVGQTGAACMKNEDTNGTGSGSLVGIPKENINYKGDKYTPADVLAHELTHAYDIDKGQIRREAPPGQIPESERRAYKLQDRIRPLLRLPALKNCENK